ncbi:DUF262 domain-containing protein [Treponema sp. OMZ 305]|uniref:DUF262 domain-containing protein n=1 Tax=Treponema sp. OMZ 305 TaxID=1659192 RepID=UPI0020A5F3FD|nr:DUF262 domain-containing HNH endonuclease family protein [Treponema sp. OMZ 305]UTC58156.1 DUF262 domain-containing protein [Treponema sp. OMZ 305]
MENSIKSLNEYLSLTSTFIIPYYQRGYIWGKKRDSKKDSAAYMIDSIIAAFEKKRELFLQGIITTKPKNNEVILIDGQQRTTFFYLLLRYLGSDRIFKIKYEIRKESDSFLQNIAEVAQQSREELVKQAKKDETEKHQDIYYFKKTIRIIHEVLKKKTPNELHDLAVFLYENIKFLCISIPDDKAITVFSMMNGNKAVMTPEELIKAELLRLVSLDSNSDEDSAKRWEQVLLRGKYAREWDRWLYWWNNNSVKEFYGMKEQSNNTLGLLLTTYYEIHKEKNADYSFAEFRSLFLKENSAQKAHDLFYDLRRLQKKFEDVYNSTGNTVELHNKIGAIIKIFNKKHRINFLVDYFSDHITQDELEKWYKYVFLSLTYNDIKKALAAEKNAEDDEPIIENDVKDLINAVSDNDLYNNNDYKQYAYLQLFRLNIEEDTKLGRAFDFSCWDNGKKSLEHILPQSKASGKNEHCIGNLVLLYKNENSAFGNKSFEDKKRMYFDFSENFKSRHLLHTMSVFAGSCWGNKEIEQNKEKIIAEIKKYYGYTK